MGSGKESESRQAVLVNLKNFILAWKKDKFEKAV
jgi:hypothetical protein